MDGEPSQSTGGVLARRQKDKVNNCGRRHLLIVRTDALPAGEVALRRGPRSLRSKNRTWKSEIGS
jgi:hypothetical protein